MGKLAVSSGTSLADVRGTLFSYNSACCWNGFIKKQNDGTLFQTVSPMILHFADPSLRLFPRYLLTWQPVKLIHITFDLSDVTRLVLQRHGTAKLRN